MYPIISYIDINNKCVLVMVWQIPYHFFLIEFDDGSD